MASTLFLLTGAVWSFAVLPWTSAFTPVFSSASTLLIAQRSSTSWSCAAHLGHGYPRRRHSVSCHPLRMQGEDRDPQITDQIEQAEAAATPMRPVRLQVYTLLGLAGGAGALVMGLGFQGNVEALRPLAESIPTIKSMEVTEGIFAALVPLCGYFYIAEEQTKQQNLRRIAERLQERRVEVVGANRDERRLKKKDKKKKKKSQ